MDSKLHKDKPLRTNLILQPDSHSGCHRWAGWLSGAVMGEWTILERLLEAAVQQHSTMIGRLHQHAKQVGDGASSSNDQVWFGKDPEPAEAGSTEEWCDSGLGFFSGTQLSIADDIETDSSCSYFTAAPSLTYTAAAEHEIWGPQDFWAPGDGGESCLSVWGSGERLDSAVGDSIAEETDTSPAWNPGWSFSALHVAVQKKDMEIVKLLLDAGADITGRLRAGGVSWLTRHGCSIAVLRGLGGMQGAWGSLASLLLIGSSVVGAWPGGLEGMRGAWGSLALLLLTGSSVLGAWSGGLGDPRSPGAAGCAPGLGEGRAVLTGDSLELVHKAGNEQRLETWFQET
ncbi:UNVERIFIED_CONTAM: hypothetical protein FKN15_057254 [Acipenser sinensis]